MLFLGVLVVAALLIGVAAVAAGRGGSMSPAEEDGPDLGLPDGHVSSHDVPRLRFRSAWRGYRMADVDEALDRLQQTLADQEEELRDLRVTAPPARGPRRGRSVTAAPEPFEPLPTPEPLPPHRPEPVVPGPEPVVPEPAPVPEPEPAPAEPAPAPEPEPAPAPEPEPAPAEPPPAEPTEAADATDADEAVSRDTEPSDEAEPVTEPDRDPLRRLRHSEGRG